MHERRVRARARAASDDRLSAAASRRDWRPVVAAVLLACAPPAPPPAPVVDDTRAGPAPWRIAPAPLLTRWAADVSPSNALPEYPRPQLVRERWRSLNGLWEWAPGSEDDDPPSGRPLPGRILVPYPIESALSGVGEHHERLWYRRTFAIPDGWAEPPAASSDPAGSPEPPRVLLHFGAVDWEATVWVNGRRLGAHRGGYDGFTVDVTDALIPGHVEQELVVGVYDPTDEGDQPRGKQALSPRGIWYSPVTGIWQSVWLEPVPASHLRRLGMTPDLARRRLAVTAAVTGARGGDSVVATALVGESVVGVAAGVPGAELLLPVPRPRAWSPDDPFLYGLRVALRRDGATVDSIGSYFGMRSVSLGADGRGGRRVELNGRPFFGVGPLDQGWWPDGLYTAPTDEALRADLETTKRLGFTMTRKHVKVEPERWYYWADRTGLAVWQDMPNASNATPSARRQFEAELWRLIEQRGNHPSIIAWVPFNEGWGQFDTRRVADYVRRLDGSRLVDDASGWRHQGGGDLIDVHRYQGPQALPRDPKRATVVGEFGGIGMVVARHAWMPDSAWGYRGVFRDADSLALRYETLMGRLWRDHATHGTSAGVYTQLTDVEREVNGLLTYDRAILKIDTARVVAANRGLTPFIVPEYREFVRQPPVVTISSTAPDVRYTTDGSEPTVESRLYRGPFELAALAAADTIVVRARAFADGEPVTGVSSAEFRRVAGRDPDSVSVELVRGVRFTYFGDSSLRALTRVASRPAGPDTTALTGDGVLASLAIPPGTTRERFTIRYAGWLRVPRDGVYTIDALADDGVRVWVGDMLVVDGMGYSPAPAESRGDVALRAGLHPLVVTHFQAYDGSRLEVYVAGPGVPRRRMDTLLYREETDSASAAETTPEQGAAGGRARR